MRALDRMGLPGDKTVRRATRFLSTLGLTATTGLALVYVVVGVITLSMFLQCYASVPEQDLTMHDHGGDQEE